MGRAVSRGWARLGLNFLADSYWWRNGSLMLAEVNGLGGGSIHKHPMKLMNFFFSIIFPVLLKAKKHWYDSGQ